MDRPVSLGGIGLLEIGLALRTKNHMAKVFDATLNALIDAHIGDWAAFLSARAGLSAGAFEVLDTDLSSTLQADRLFRIDGPVPFVLHVELQTTGHLGMPKKLLRYNVNVPAFEGRDLPVHSVLVLLRPKANASDQTGTLESLGADGRPYNTFHYTVIRIWEEKVSDLLAAGPGLAPLAILTNEAATDLEGAFERFRERLKQPELSTNVEKGLLTATFFLLGLRYDNEQIAKLYGRLSMTLEDSTTYQWVMAKGEARGEAKGIAQGRAEGKAEGLEIGRLTEARNIVARQGTKRFGEAPQAAREALSAIADHDRLERIADRMFEATDWNDLLATS
jgi:hypothetical protein